MGEIPAGYKEASQVGWALRKSEPENRREEMSMRQGMRPLRKRKRKQTQASKYFSFI